jgi:SAM-dependent methyltransferase
VSKAEFDAFAQSFADMAGQNTSFFGGDYGYFGRYRSRIVKGLVGEDIGAILDFGCGVGLGVEALGETFPKTKIVGCDPSEESLAVAREKLPLFEFVKPDALPASAQFDIVMAVSVFHHIAPEARDAALRYCFDRVKRGGHVFIFEHNPYNSVTQYLVARCAFDHNAILLPPAETLARVRRAGFEQVGAQYCLFFPKALAWFRPIESWLGWLPLGGQYYVWGVRPDTDDGRRS